MRKMQPVSVAGIISDAVLDMNESHSSAVPQYPVDTGYCVQDNVAINPMSLSMTLYLTETPVTWLNRNDNGNGRVRRIWDQLFDIYSKKNPITVTTPEASYSNMVINSIAYKKTQEIGYAAEIPIELTQVTVTSVRTAMIPAEYARAGASRQLAGSAATSAATSLGSVSGNGIGGIIGNLLNSDTKQTGSWLYQMASGVGNKTGWFNLD